MAAPTKPLVMTLGKALSVLQKRGLRLVPPEEGTDSWGTTRVANWDAPDHEFDTWPEAVSDALGRTVVDANAPARDDAAELRAALREWAEATRAAEWFELDQTNAYGDDHIDAEDRVEAARRALLALAATEGQP